jgi:cytochrome P450
MSWKDVLPKDIVEMKATVNKFLDPVIKESTVNIKRMIEEYKNTTENFDPMQLPRTEDLLPEGKPLIDHLVYATIRELGKRNLELSEREFIDSIFSNLMQITFAAVETTPAASGNLIFGLANDPEKQDYLRNLMREYDREQGGAKPLTYDQFNNPNHRALIEIVKYVGHKTSEEPVTFVSVRGVKQDVSLSNGGKLSKGATVMLNLHDSGSNYRSRMQNQADYGLKMAQNTADNQAFGFGECVGASSALYEQDIFLAQMLRRLDKIQVRGVGGDIYRQYAATTKLRNMGIVLTARE